LAPAKVEATLFSGNPVADGWAFSGDSLVTGASYVGGAPGNGNFNDGNATFKLYSKTTTVTAQFLIECGATCAAWLVGDTIYGLGAVFPSEPGGGVQSNLGAVLLKWGVTSSVYSLSFPFSHPLGNGNRDHNNGDGGLGSVMATINLPGVSGISTPTSAFQWTGTTGSPGFNITLGNYIAFNTILSGSNIASYEGYLNATLLYGSNPASISSPYQFGGNSIIGVRSGGNAFLETHALVAGIPEPATGFLAAGALLAGWLVRRRRIAS
jgi:uncharacterized protein (TIGR03382 family)